MIERSITTQQVFIGPLPPPEQLKQYDAIIPGFANRIVAMVELQTAHRMALENKVIISDIRRSYLGLVVGLIVALTCIVGGLVVISQGHDGAGATVATGVVVALVGVFVYGSNARHKERSEKARSVQKK